MVVLNDTDKIHSVGVLTIRYLNIRKIFLKLSAYYERLSVHITYKSCLIFSSVGPKICTFLLISIVLRGFCHAV